jgi:uncharacterized NAD-dependent epimerase/dehydratase family protein
MTKYISEKNRIVLLMNNVLGEYSGKFGHGLLRYCMTPIVAVVDEKYFGHRVCDVTNIPCDVPIVKTIEDALIYHPDVLIPAVSPPGGILPEDWALEIEEGLSFGLSLVHGFHTPLGKMPRFTHYLQRPNQFIWDIRQEPEGLGPSTGTIRHSSVKRILFVGTDMNNGKMTAALEMDKEARRQGLRSKFLATGQTGIAIAGEGIALDAIRVDYATGAVEKLIMDNQEGNDILFIEGQGSLFNPFSTATLSLMRGSMPHHLILVHRAGQKTIKRADWVNIPPLNEVTSLYNLVSTGCNVMPSGHVSSICLNTSQLSEEDALIHIKETEEMTGLPVNDPVRFGTGNLLRSIL